MKKTLWFGLFALTLCFASTANSALIDNGIYTTDDETGLQWLDLSVTGGLSYNGAATVFGDNGGGWRYATNAEVVDLFGKLFIGYYDNVAGASMSKFTHYADQQEDVDNMFALFGQSGVVSSGTRFSMGFYTDEAGRNTDMGVSSLSDATGVETIVFGPNYTADFPRDTAYSQIGTFVVRNTTVPIPAAAWLFGSSLLGLFGFSRRNRRA